jgi:hypothetical protein
MANTYQVTSATGIGSIPPLVDAETGNVILEGRIRTPADAVGIFRALQSADLRSSQQRAVEQALIDGAPPYSDSQDMKDGLYGRSNINWGLAGQAQLEAETPFQEYPNAVDTFCTMPTDYGETDEERNFYSQIIAEEFTRMMRNWDEFDTLWGFNCHLFTKEGLSFVFFEDELTWKWRVYGQEYFKFPRKTRATVNTFDVVACQMEWLPHELYDRIRDPEIAVEEGWNPPAVFEAIKTAGVRSVYTNNPQDIERNWKNNDIYQSMTASTVKLVFLLCREVNGTVSSYIARLDGEGEFLYKKVGKYRSMNRALIAYTAGVGSNGDFNSIRGNGNRIYGPTTGINRMMCKFLDLTIHDSTPRITADSEDAIDSNSFRAIGPYVSIQDGVQFQEMPTPNYEQSMIPAISMLQDMFRQRASISAPSLSGDMVGRERTKYEVQVQTEMAGKVSSGQMNLFFSSLRQHMQEVARRVIREDYSQYEPGGEEVWDFKLRCFKRGVPIQAIYRVDIKALEVNRGIGIGSVAERRSVADALQERLGAQLDPKGQQILRRMIASAYGGATVGKLLVPDEPGMRPVIDVQIANMENALLALGQPVIIEPNQNHQVHCETHLQRVQQLNEQFAGQQMDLYQFISQAQPIWVHGQEHLALLDPMAPATAQLREGYQQLGETITNGAKEIEAEEVKQAEAGGQPNDPTSGVFRQAVDAQARTAELDEAERIMRMQQMEEDHRQKIAIRAAETASKLRKTAAELASKQK